MTDAGIEVVCVGETMGQFVPADGRGIETAGTFALHQAGAESNVAIGLARLGHRSAWISRVGDDAVGRRIVSALATAGVTTFAIVDSEGRPTGIFLKDPRSGSNSVTYFRRGSAASLLASDDVDRAVALRPAVIHLSGVTPALSESCSASTDYALSTARAAGVTSSFDVNYRPALWSSVATAARRLSELANRSDVVFVGLDEAQRLWGAETGEAVRSILPRTGVVVIKDAERRAVAFHGDLTTSVAALQVEVVDSVGAGDAFAAGWLSAYLSGHDQRTRLRFGHLLARAALRSLSDQGNLIPRTELADLARDESLWTTTKGDRL